MVISSAEAEAAGIQEGTYIEGGKVVTYEKKPYGYERTVQTSVVTRGTESAPRVYIRPSLEEEIPGGITYSMAGKIAKAAQEVAKEEEGITQLSLGYGESPETRKPTFTLYGKRLFMPSAPQSGTQPSQYAPSYKESTVPATVQTTIVNKTGLPGTTLGQVTEAGRGMSNYPFVNAGFELTPEQRETGRYPTMSEAIDIAVTLSDFNYTKPVRDVRVYETKSGEKAFEVSEQKGGLPMGGSMFTVAEEEAKKRYEETKSVGLFSPLLFGAPGTKEEKARQALTQTSQGISIFSQSVMSLIGRKGAKEKAEKSFASALVELESPLSPSKAFKFGQSPLASAVSASLLGKGYGALKTAGQPVGQAIAPTGRAIFGGFEKAGGYLYFGAKAYKTGGELKRGEYGKALGTVLQTGIEVSAFQAGYETTRPKSFLQRGESIYQPKMTRKKGLGVSELELEFGRMGFEGVYTGKGRKTYVEGVSLPDKGADMFKRSFRTSLFSAETGSVKGPVSVSGGYIRSPEAGEVIPSEGLTLVREVTGVTQTPRGVFFGGYGVVPETKISYEQYPVLTRGITKSVGEPTVIGEFVEAGTDWRTPDKEFVQVLSNLKSLGQAISPKGFSFTGSESSVVSEIPVIPSGGGGRVMSPISPGYFGFGAGIGGPAMEAPPLSGLAKKFAPLYSGAKPSRIFRPSSYFAPSPQQMGGGEVVYPSFPVSRTKFKEFTMNLSEKGLKSSLSAHKIGQMGSVSGKTIQKTALEPIQTVFEVPIQGRIQKLETKLVTEQKTALKITPIETGKPIETPGYYFESTLTGPPIIPPEVPMLGWGANLFGKSKSKKKKRPFAYAPTVAGIAESMKKGVFAKKKKKMEEVGVGILGLKPRLPLKTKRKPLGKRKLPGVPKTIFGRSGIMKSGKLIRPIRKKKKKKKK